MKTAIARADDDYNKADKVTGRAQTFREIEAVFYWIMNYIKLNEEFTEWTWYDDLSVRVLYLHLLLKAYNGGEWFYGNPPAIGSCGFRADLLASSVGLTPARLNTAIKKLVKSGFVTIEKKRGWWTFTITHFEEYQINL